MNLHQLLKERAAAGRPVRVALIGAGKFGSMFLSQIPTTPGLEIAVIADLDTDRARDACRQVGWDDRRIDRTEFVTSGADACGHPEVEVVVEATGSPSHVPARCLVPWIVRAVVPGRSWSPACGPAGPCGCHGRALGSAPRATSPPRS